MNQPLTSPCFNEGHINSSLTTSSPVEHFSHNGYTLPRDFSYFKNFYSKPTAYLAYEIAKYSDTFDYPTSFLYDEYPDKQLFRFHVTKFIEQLNPPPEEVWIPSLIEVLMLQEFLYRRNRKPIE